MGFLDNSGDIILDAVLTDTGRKRLAKGDGSFKIVKFALGDDEIDYSTFNNAHPSGSAYFDLEILQTPVLEAFTNNASSMKHKLVTYNRDDLLYLPRIEWYYNASGETPRGNFSNQIAKVLVDSDTVSGISATNSSDEYMKYDGNGEVIILEQGLNTTEISWKETLQSDLLETQYIIEMDHRLGMLQSGDGSGGSRTVATPSFIDDDNIASYYVSLGVDNEFVKDKTTYVPWANKLSDTTAPNTTPNGPIKGPFGTALLLFVMPSLNLKTSTFYFTKIGRAATINSVACNVIDSTVRVTGATTGFSIDIPIRYIKKV
tara:strand:- start:1903 stop:2853 length:951 start_codon:yes stop_codon:yes gene_type:complete